MAKVQVQVTVEGSSYDLGKQLGNLVEALIAKKPLAEIAAQELVQIQSIANDISAVKGDLADDKAAFVEGAVLGLKETLFPAPAAVAAPQV